MQQEEQRKNLMGVFLEIVKDGDRAIIKKEEEREKKGEESERERSEIEKERQSEKQEESLPQ